MLCAGDLCGHATVVFLDEIERVAFGAVGMGEGATHQVGSFHRCLIAHVDAEEFLETGDVVAGGHETFGLEVEYGGRAVYAEPGAAGLGVEADQLHAFRGFFVGDREGVAGGDVFEVDELLASGGDESAQTEVFQVG